MAFETIQIMHINDLHSHLENWPKIKRFLTHKRAAYLAKGEPTLIFDIGDAEDRAHPLTEATNGQANVALFNEIGFDGVTIGNNEGIGNSHDQLEHLYDQANFDVILGNLFEPDGTRPAFAKVDKIITTPQGTRIGVLGLTAPFFLTYIPNGWQPKIVQNILPQLLAQIQPKCDIIVLLSHLGIEMDRYIAKHFPQIQIILGAHTHHLLPVGERHGQTMLGAAGKYGEYVGTMTLQVNDQHQLEAVSAQVQKTADLPADPGDQATIKHYQDEGHRLLRQEKVAFLPEPLPTDYQKPTKMMQVALKALEARGHTGAAILNQGLFLRDLAAGLVTKDDLHDQMPHPMHLIKVSLRGYDLWRLVMEMEKNRRFLSHFPIRGMSFRGKVFGELVYDGIAVEPGTRRVFWHDEELNPEQTYTFTTVDHYLFIPFFPTIEIVGDNEFLFPEFLRDAVGNYLATQYPLSQRLPK
ncbi:MAG: metallophosphatase [Lactobacillus sp.]|jgi:2',3'-cyclic-nucleotide 2'-phosphodiesterase (5'-nucleotidase family)|nr:metallophosphatase [Lactobacillus sp.]